MSKIELRFKCFDLKNMDLMSKSDPQVFVQQTFSNSKPFYLGSTEKINNNLSPIFKKPITISYCFEQVQTLKFVVLDVDGEITDIDKPDYIGELTCNLSDILSSPGRKYTKQLRNKKNSYGGEIEITAEEIQTTNCNIEFTIEGTKFDKKDLIGSSDPYFIIYRFSPTIGENVRVFQSEVIKNNLNPVFKPVHLKLEEFNNGDYNTPLTFEFFDFDDIGKHDLIGVLKTTTQEIISKFEAKASLEIINPKKSKVAGSIRFTTFKIIKTPTFLDYIYTGTQLNMYVAIDCTYSNGPITSASSLHKFTTGGTQLNQYETSILSVGNVLAGYCTSSNQIPVFGFGGHPAHLKEVSHCFSMTLDESNPNVFGVQGILDVYRANIPKVEFSGPTNFASIINRVACCTPNSQYQYNILLILTDGEITDLEQTKREVIKASKLPMSVVIVAVGNAGVASQLDSDDELLSDLLGNKAERDIVQFVQFNKAAARGSEFLAAEVLREIPNQLLGFMSKRGFVPTPKPI